MGGEIIISNVFICLIVIFGILAAAIQILIFVLECFKWRTDKVMKMFQIKNAEEAETTSLMALNQGWYNLFIAVIDIIGFIMLAAEKPEVGSALLFAGCGSALAAAVVLFCAKASMRSLAVKQGFLPLIEIIILCIALAA